MNYGELIKKNRKRWACIFIINLISISVVVSLSLSGINSRQFLNRQIFYKINRPEESFHLWQNLGLRGRTLLYLDRHFSIDQAFIESLNLRFENMGRSQLPSITERNFIIFSLYDNIFRKVYHLIPDKAWQEVKKDLSQYAFVAFDGKRFRLTIEGIPIIIMPINEAKDLSEPAVVYINGTYKHEYNEQKLASIINNPSLSEMVVIYEPRE